MYSQTDSTDVKLGLTPEDILVKERSVKLADLGSAFSGMLTLGLSGFLNSKD